MSAVQTQQRPAGTGRLDRKQNTSGLNNNSNIDPLQQLLDRLDGVINTGMGWRARCPAHGSRATSISISEGGNGTVLLNAFCGCSTHDVLAAVGLTVSDLFQRRDLRTLSHAERSQMRQAALLPRWRAALAVLETEATVLLIAADKLADGNPLSEADRTRLIVAALRVFDAGEALIHGR